MVWYRKEVHKENVDRSGKFGRSAKPTQSGYDNIECFDLQ